jgi:phage/plasmid-like protein (TIGR03299 family)
MPAEFESGMFVKEPAWHGLGKVLENAPENAEQAIEAAGLDWGVGKYPLWLEDVDESGERVYNKFPLSYAIVRESDKSILGSVGPQYTPVQNKEMFSWFDPFVESGECEYNTAGSLFDGAKVWVLAKINRQNMEVIPGDEITKFLLLSNSHDGKNAVRVGFTPIRVVCANTLAMAHNDKNSKLIRVRHSSKVMTNLNNIRETIDAVNEQFEATAEQFRVLANSHINQADLTKYVRVLMDVDVNIAESEISTRKKGLIDQVMKLIAKESDSNNRIKDTWWAAYNGWNTYTQHVYGRTAENRVDNLWFGGGVAENQKALSYALELATN